MKLCIVGVTGLVGSQLIQVLNESPLHVDEFICVASEKSKGKKMLIRGNEYTVVTPDEACNMKPDIAIFSAGSAVSKEWAPRFAEKGCFVIDNSSQWRMFPNVPLVASEAGKEYQDLNGLLSVIPPHHFPIRCKMALVTMNYLRSCLSKIQ